MATAVGIFSVLAAVAFRHRTDTVRPEEPAHQGGNRDGSY